LAPLPYYRTIIAPNGEAHKIHFSGNIEVNSVEALSQLCIKGFGVAPPPAHLIESALARGELIELLPGWQVEPIPLYAVWPANTLASSNVKKLVSYISV